MITTERLLSILHRIDKQKAASPNSFLRLARPKNGGQAARGEFIEVPRKAQNGVFVLCLRRTTGAYGKK
jgi:hypothetical protein